MISFVTGRSRILTKLPQMLREDLGISLYYLNILARMEKFVVEQVALEISAL